MPAGVSLDDALVIRVAGFGTMVHLEFRSYFAISIPIAAEFFIAGFVQDAWIKPVGLQDGPCGFLESLFVGKFCQAPQHDAQRSQTLLAID